MEASEQYILIRGASENNLKDIHLNIPKRKLVVFAGVSGSGKSSLVFDTIAIEAARQLQDTFPVHVRNRMPHYHAASVEWIDHLSTAIIVDQRALSGNARSTVGTMTDIMPMMRLLYSRCATPSAGFSGAYSFNDANGMCLTCSGLGHVSEFDMERIIDRKKSLNEGAIQFPGHQVGACLWQVYANSGLYDPDQPMEEYTEQEWHDFLHGTGVTVTIHNTTGKVWGDSYQQTYEGFQDRIERLYLRRNLNSMSKATQNIIEQYTIPRVCPVCHGQRLNEAARRSYLCGYNIAEFGELEISDAIRVLGQVSDPIGMVMAKKIVSRLRDIENIGLGYLNLNRASTSLSNGELQRLKMVRHLGSSLVDLMYIFDEPSAGLHPKDVDRIKELILRLRDRGNSVLVVEHNLDMIRAADHVIEIGPMAGAVGGDIVFQGAVPKLLESDTITAKYLRENHVWKQTLRTPLGWLEVCHAACHNLKDVSVRIPRNCLTAVTGVAGAGKSSLICGDFLKQHPEAVLIEQKLMGSNGRSTPATYTGAMDEIRSLFGRSNRVSPNYFSHNSAGACPVCKGKGLLSLDMAFMDAVEVECEACHGSRYGDHVLQYHYKGKTILDVLDMSVEDALIFFSGQKKIIHKLEMLKAVGLGYLKLGQPTSTLSGGECQRIKIASYLKETNQIYIMDEPTTGLHGYDVDVLISLLNKLVDQGNTLIVIDHNMKLVCQADWMIDLGPDGGKNGGEVVFEGIPKEIMKCEKSHTGAYLKKFTAECTG